MPLGLSVNALAKALNVPAPRLNDVVRERRGLSADSAMRLARYFGGDARTWLHLQAAYDLRVAAIANAKRVKKGGASQRPGEPAQATMSGERDFSSQEISTSTSPRCKDAHKLPSSGAIHVSNSLRLTLPLRIQTI